MNKDVEEKQTQALGVAEREKLKISTEVVACHDFISW